MRPIYLALYVLFGAMALIIISAMYAKPATRFHIGPEMQEKVKRLARASKNWGQAAELNREDPLLKFEHAIYSLAYKQAATTLMSESDLAALTGYDVDTLQTQVDQLREATLASIVSQCPALQSKSTLAVASGWV